MVLNEYEVVLTHDNGNAKFKLCAIDVETAINTVLSVENAPKNSVKSVKKLRIIN